MAFVASVAQAMTKDMTGFKEPRKYYNKATGKFEKNPEAGNYPYKDKLPLDRLRRNVNPTDSKVREHLRRAGV